MTSNSTNINNTTQPALSSAQANDQDDKATLRSSDVLYWVGIGASAGGLEALRELVDKIPTSATQNSNITYIVAQHLSPTHQSMLVQLMGHSTNLQVKECGNGEVPEPNVMYITPPNRDVFVEEGALWLREPPSEISPKPSVDLLFTSLAEQIGDQAIGVILSGTGSDGAHGVRAIRAAGGLTIVQQPDTAKYDGMPKAAIDTRCADLILRPYQIIGEIATMIRMPRQLDVTAETASANNDISELLFLLKERSGVDFKNYKPGTLYRRIDRRIHACGAQDVSEYLDHIVGNKGELDVLFKDIMISVTSFFRDKDAFDALSTAIAEMLDHKADDEPIRIWIPGCATGEEAYSIAIMITEHLGGLNVATLSRTVQIFATDIDTDALTVARKGQYPLATLEKMNPTLRQKYFRQRNMYFEVAKPVRDMIVFSRHNLLEDPPFLRLDLVSCRNLLIYFNASLQHHVLNVFNYSLNPTGNLFLGKSESLGASTSLFQSIDSKSKIYCRKLVPSRDSSAVMRSSLNIVNKPRVPSLMANANKAIHDLPDAMIQAFAPDSLLIDENMDVVRIYGDIHAYMQLSPGGASTNLMSMARKEFRQELRALVYKVLRENSKSSILPKKLDIQGETRDINIIIRSLSLKNSPERLVVVSFEQNTSTHYTRDNQALSEAASDNPLIAEMEQELIATREHLQTVVEELETSNEELQSTNEEMQSTNEELQSSNEEMETSNEELQSTNEELITVNEELNVKTAELTIANEELNNIRESIDYPLLVVDRELCIKRYNSASHKLFLLNDKSEGAALTNIATHIDLPQLREHILSVIDTGKAHTRQIDNGHVAYLERISAYQDDSNRIMGAVLTYNNNSGEREAQRALEASQERYNLAVEGANSGIWDWDINTGAMFWSPMLCEMLQLKPRKKSQTFGQFRARIHPDERDDVISILNAHLERGFEFNVECRMRQSKDSYIWVHLTGKAVWDEHKNAQRMAGSITDITDRRNAVNLLTESNESLERFAYVCSHDLKEPVRMIDSFLGLFMEQYHDKLDEEGTLYMDHICKASKRIQKMIKDIFTYSQLETRSKKFCDVDCHQEIERALENLALTIRETNAKISIAPMPTLSGDPMQVSQIFQNLLSNSLKFCKNKQPEIAISATEYDDSYEFAVTDNGIGMKHEYATRIFGVFERLHSNEEYPGTGIGLSICQRSVARHGGKIWVHSTPDVGTTFYFTLSKHLNKRKGYAHEYASQEAS